MSARSVAPGAFTLRLNGLYFTASTVVRFDGVALPVTRVSATQLSATGTTTAAQQGKDVPVVTSQTGVGGFTNDPVSVRVTAETPVPTPTPTPTPTPSPTPTPTPTPRHEQQRDASAVPQPPVRRARRTAPAHGRHAGSAERGVDEQNLHPNGIIPYLQIVSRHAFGNYRALLGEIATRPQRGKYLDLANSTKPSAGGGANERFAHELMQLFSIGRVKLHADGSVMAGPGGAPVAPCDHITVMQLALAFTGWTSAGAGNNNGENFSGPLQPRDTHHDKSAKSLLGCYLPAGQAAQQKMTAALVCVFTPHTWHLLSAPG